MQSFTNKPLLGKFPHKVRVMKSVFSLGSVQTFLKMFWRVAPIICVLSLQSIRVTPRLRHMNKFLYKIYIMNSNHGSLYTVKYLRACHVAIQKHISDNKVKSLQTIEPGYPFPRLINGLPPIILSMDRAEIRNKNPKVIRWWLSLFSIYRVLEAPRKVKLNTITDGYSGSYACIGSLKIPFLKTFSTIYRGRNSLFNIKSLEARHLRPSIKAGPNSRFAFMGAFSDIASLSRYPKLLEAFRAYGALTGSHKFLDLFERGLTMATTAHHYDKMTWKYGSRNGFDEDRDTFLLHYPDVFLEYDVNHVHGRKVVTKVTDPGAWHDFFPGRLVGIPEPAGKMRVIAICDIWTQSLFEPLHRALFKFLRSLPNDGTFDQNAAFDRAVSKASTSEGIYCADLSAATDRLPLDLQEMILNMFYGHSVKRNGRTRWEYSNIGTLWATLFRERPFIVREPIAQVDANTIVHYGLDNLWVVYLHGPCLL